jgi:hypothetical protein
MSEVTELLEAVANGDPTAVSRVLPPTMGLTPAQGSAWNSKEKPPAASRE